MKEKRNRAPMTRNAEEFSEARLRDWVFAELYAYFSNKTKMIGELSGGDFHIGMFERVFHIHKEAKLEYSVGGSHRISHKCDLLLSFTNKQNSRTPIMNVEIKYRSSVTDSFKARAYDQQHLKIEHKLLCGALAYVKPSRSGISFKQAHCISYPFDGFVFIEEPDAFQTKAWNILFAAIENRMRAIASDPSVPAIYVVESGKKQTFPVPI